MALKPGMKFILFLLIFFVLAVTSCEKQCIKAQTAFSLIGFSDAEADTIILRKFSKGSFSQPLDTVLLEHILFQRSHDTLNIVASPGFVTMFSDYNYEIFFPEPAKLLTITDIIENENTMNQDLFSCKKDACSNTITGYTVNGEVSDAVSFGYLIHLKK